jgi:hypothetical protein
MIASAASPVMFGFCKQIGLSSAEWAAPAPAEPPEDFFLVESARAYVLSGMVMRSVVPLVLVATEGLPPSDEALAVVEAATQSLALARRLRDDDATALSTNSPAAEAVNRALCCVDGDAMDEIINAVMLAYAEASDI